MDYPEEKKQQRMKQDAEFIKNVADWPCYPVLHLKTQPWVEPRGKFGIVIADNVLEGSAYKILVIPKKLDNSLDRESVEAFDTVEELVQRWSVD